MWNHTQNSGEGTSFTLNSHERNNETPPALAKSLDLSAYLKYVDQVFNQPSSDSEASDGEFQLDKNPMMSSTVPGRLANDMTLVQLSKSSDTSSNCSLNLSVSSPSSSTSGLSSASDTEFSGSFDALKLAPINDDELENLLKIHKVWRKSPYPLGSQADIMSLLNAAHSKQSPEKSTKSKSSRPLLNDNVMLSSANSKGRSRKQSLKNVRNEESLGNAAAAAAAAAAAGTSSGIVAPSSAVECMEIKEEPIIKKEELESVVVEPTTSIKPPPVVGPLTNFMDEDEDSEIENDEEDDNDSLSDYMSMSAAASTGAGTLRASTSNGSKPKPVVTTATATPPVTTATTTSVEATPPVPTIPTPPIVAEPVVTKKIKKEKEATGTKPGKKLSLQKQAKLIEVLNMKRRRVYVLLCKKEIGKTQRARTNNHKENLVMKRRLAQACSRNLRQKAIQSQKAMKESVWRAKRLAREMVSYWKQADRVEREVRKRREKEAEEQRKQDVELMEAKRQQRKLNFLITQTELYAHFMSKKLGTSAGYDESRILNQLNEEKNSRLASIDDYDSNVMKAKAKQNVENAFKTQQSQVKLFDLDVTLQEDFKNDLKLESIDSRGEFNQPKMFEGVLKHYQLKGLNWLINLYDQGINGILADEMGLGKTVQSMAFLGHVAERYGIWGPFLIIAPASTLHNWQQEFKRFVPQFKVVPYWGNPQERKILRQFWQQSNLHTEEASFHVVVTSYQIVMTDLKYFNRIKWQYLILDEAQAIKSTASARWKMLLGFSCRNRLLLTGTPIQNTMAELWALLHFIMPSLFDSHDEFNEWFSKDIESHAENKSLIDEKHLSRLHLILKPFMLRRIKKDVENELSDKVEVLVHCPLTSRQRILYTVLKKKIRIEDLLKSAGPANSQLVQHATTNLMNLVMQFRKVCNHPDLFERREVQSPHRLPTMLNEYPKLIFREAMTDSPPSRLHLLENKFSVFNPVHVHRSLTGHCDSTSLVPSVNSEWSFLRFSGLGVGEVNRIVYGGIIERWKHILRLYEKIENLYHQQQWSSKDSDTDGNNTCFLSQQDLLLWPHSTTSFPNIHHSPILQDLVFTNYTSSLYTLKDHRIFRIPETIESRKLRTRVISPFSEEKQYHKRAGSTIQQEVRTLQKTYMPSFLYYLTPKVSGCGRELYFRDRSAAWKLMEYQMCTTVEGYNLVWHGKSEMDTENTHFIASNLGGLKGIQPTHGWSLMVVPDKEKLVTDSGKLGVLDCLLKRLKTNGHRVLIYSQMTKMIDILEEYMWHRKWTYMRLDGSSKIAERRDMVADFQSRSDIFVFLLSTRAGGLGINLTAADTVIFYDSDWNPTVDQQAMDRAHRLGQTKQVHVYRLICKGTIEERILQRAREKNEIQRMVISGGNFRSDALKPKEVVSLLLDDEELEKKYRQKQAERRIVEEKSTTPEASKESKPSTSGSILGKRKHAKNGTPSEKLSGDAPSSSVSSSTGGSAEDSSPPSPIEGYQDLVAGEVEVDSEMFTETVEDDKSSHTGSFADDADAPLSPSITEGFKTIEWGNDSVSDFESDFTVLPKRAKVVRGTGKRGRPPSRIRAPVRETEVGDTSVRRGPGRPRLRPVGPANTGIRGRRPGRPPLSRKAESLSSSLTPLTASQRVFGFYSSPDLDIS